LPDRRFPHKKIHPVTEVRRMEKALTGPKLEGFTKNTQRSIPYASPDFNRPIETWASND
jgi:hypothetical protein